jgi:hypothetical protein
MVFWMKLFLKMKYEKCIKMYENNSSYLPTCKTIHFMATFFVGITSYNKILLTSDICNFTSHCP